MSYSVYLLAEDGTAETVDVRNAASVEAAETVALAAVEARWPGRGWLVSHVEEDERTVTLYTASGTLAWNHAAGRYVPAPERRIPAPSRRSRN
jgi:hypothetical protein